MTPADWDQVKGALSMPYGRVTLRCDAFELALQVSAVGPLRFEIVSYVDGHFTGEWIVNDCEQRRRFLRPRTVPMYPRAKRAQLVAKFGRKRAEEWFDLGKTYTHWSWGWPSFAPLKRHLVANNQSIELVEIQ